MQKQAVTFGCYVLIASAFSAFFRWVQNLAAFELETGLMKPGIFWSKVALVITALALIGVAVQVRRLWYKGHYPAQTYDKLIQGNPYLLDRITKVIAAVMIVGAVINMFIGSYSVYRSILGLLSVLAIGTAVAFVKLSQLPYEEKQNPLMHSLLALVPVVFYVDWLTVSYRIHAAMPSVWAYAPEIIAICASLIGVFYFAGYAFEYPHPYLAMGWLMAGAILSLTTIMDDRNIGQQLMLAAGAAMQMYDVWMIVTSLSDQWPEEAEVPEGDGTTNTQ